MRVRWDWGKVQTFLGTEGKSLSGFWGHPWAEPRIGWGAAFQPEQGPCRTPDGVCPMNQELLQVSFPWKVMEHHSHPLNEIPRWEKGMYFCCCCSKSVRSFNQCTRTERHHKNFFKIMIGHNVQILKELKGLGNGSLMAANIHTRQLDIRSLLMEEHNTTCEGFYPSPQHPKKGGESYQVIRFPYLNTNSEEPYETGKHVKWHRENEISILQTPGDSVGQLGFFDK